jgi:hypothetical protein
MTNRDPYRGFQARENWFSKTVTNTAKVSTRVWSPNSVYFVGGLPTDFNSTSNPIINGISVRIQFTLSSNNFLLQSEYGAAKFELEEAMISIPCAEISDELSMSIEARIKREPSVIQFRRRQCVPYVIPTNSSVFHSDSKLVSYLL